MYADLAGPKVRTLDVHVRHDARVRIGDRIALVRKLHEAKPDEAAITCTIPAILDHLRDGDPMWIDDGRIGCVVERVDPSRADLRITQATERGDRLRPDKGLNFPKTEIPAAPLSAADREALAAILDVIDVVGYSFVRKASDIETLQDELARLGRPILPLALKIETLEGVNNLPALIAQAAGRQPTAVMIARGDLAVEIGYRRLAEMQEEILWLCEAASIPVIWATQVLDEFVKTGMPTRAEITDAAYGRTRGLRHAQQGRTRRSGRGSARRPPPVDGGAPDEEDVAHARPTFLVAELTPAIVVVSRSPPGNWRSGERQS